VYQNGQIREASTLTTPCAQPAAHGQETAANCGTCAPPVRKRRRTALLWGISGTVISAVGWIALMLFEQYNASLSELRTDLKHFNEARAELVKKETLHKMIDHLKDSTRELQAAVSAREALARELKASEKSRHALARELQKMRERLATVEGRCGAMAVILPPAGANCSVPSPDQDGKSVPCPAPERLSTVRE
jgi:hypothetical protein